MSAGAERCAAYQCVPRLACRQQWFTRMGPFKDTLGPSHSSELIIAMFMCWRAFSVARVFFFFFVSRDWMETVLRKVDLKSHHDLCSVWKSHKSGAALLKHGLGGSPDGDMTPLSYVPTFVQLRVSCPWAPRHKWRSVVGKLFFLFTRNNVACDKHSMALLNI